MKITTGTVSIAGVFVVLLGATWQAMASFGDGKMFRVAHEKAGIYRVAYDMGTGSGLTLSTITNYLLDGKDLSQGQGPLSLSDWVDAYGPYTLTMTTYDPDGAGNTGAIPAGGASSQDRKGRSMPGSVQTSASSGGRSVGTISTAGSSEAGSDSPRASWSGGGGSAISPGGQSVPGYVDDYYYYGDPNDALEGLKVCTIRTYADGHTEINPVPIPSAVYLLGSGILGLIGILRSGRSRTGL
jgi:hypothetical protein